MNQTPIPEIRVLRRVEPTVPVGHPNYVWTNGADVQATWKRFGWVPVSPTPYALSQEQAK